MTAFATLSGNRVTRANLHLPALGVWWLDVELDAEVTLEGGVSAVLADLELEGTVASGGPFRGSSRYRVVGGKGGWGSDIKALDYANDLGVKRRTVIGDAAMAAGEQLELDTVPSDTVGPKWTRPAGPASRVLHLLAPEGWFVGEDGITRIGRRPAVQRSAGTILNHDVERGVLELASDEIAELVPGAIVEGVEAVDVLHELTPQALRTTLWGAEFGGTSRRLAAWKRLIDALLPDYKFRGVTEYRVVKQTGERFDLQPVRSGLGMPDLSRVRARPGIPGARGTVAPGGTCLVAFVNSDPGRAVIISFEDAESSGFAPSRLDLVGVDDDAGDVGDESGRALRYGDHVAISVVGGGGGVAQGAIARGPSAPSFSRVRL